MLRGGGAGGNYPPSTKKTLAPDNEDNEKVNLQVKEEEEIEEGKPNALLTQGP